MYYMCNRVEIGSCTHSFGIIIIQELAFELAQSVGQMSIMLAGQELVGETGRGSPWMLATVVLWSGSCDCAQLSNWGLCCEWCVDCGVSFKRKIIEEAVSSATTFTLLWYKCYLLSRSRVCFWIGLIGIAMIYHQAIMLAGKGLVGLRHPLTVIMLSTLPAWWMT